MWQLTSLIGFDWDSGNIDKNWQKHQVKNEECEQIFFNKPLLVIADKIHSQTEIRYYALGKTFSSKFLFIVFTTRKNKIRIISARLMNKNEHKIYEQKK